MYEKPIFICFDSGIKSIVMIFQILDCQVILAENLDNSF